MESKRSLIGLSKRVVAIILTMVLVIGAGIWVGVDMLRERDSEGFDPIMANPEILDEATAIANSQGYGHRVPVRVGEQTFDYNDISGITYAIRLLSIETGNEAVITSAANINSCHLMVMNGEWFTNLSTVSDAEFYAAFPGHSLTDYNNAVKAAQQKIAEVFAQICAERGLDENGYPKSNPTPTPTHPPTPKPSQPPAPAPSAAPTPTPAPAPTPTPAPAKPNVPTVSASATSYNKAVVSWTKVPGVSGYELYRATAVNGKYKLLKKTTGASYSNSGLSTGTTYYYKVRSYTKVGKKTTYGEFSAPVAATPAIGSVTKVTATATSCTKVKVSWTTVSGAKYRVYRSTSLDGEYKLVKTTSSKSFTDSKLPPGVTYYYKVQTYRNSAKGDFSPAASATPVLGAVTSPKAVRKSASSIKVTWRSVSGKSGYEIWRATSPEGGYVKVKTTSGTSLTDKKLASGTTYYYKIRAYCKIGKNYYYGGFSPAVSATP